MYSWVFPGAECTETPYIPGGGYGSNSVGYENIGYWNDTTGYPYDTQTVFCPLEVVTSMFLREYDWDKNDRVSEFPIKSYEMIPWSNIKTAYVHAYVINNNTYSTERDVCRVECVYDTGVNGYFDIDSSQNFELQHGYNHVKIDVTDLIWPNSYLTLVCRIPNVDPDTGLPSQIAGYTLEVVE